jgi:hypothetical protein
MPIVRPNRWLQRTVTGVLRPPVPAAEPHRYAPAPSPYVACRRSSRAGGIRVDVGNDRTPRLGIQAEASMLAGQEKRSPSFKNVEGLGRPSVSVPRRLSSITQIGRRGSRVSRRSCMPKAMLRTKCRVASSPPLPAFGRPVLPCARVVSAKTVAVPRMRRLNGAAWPVGRRGGV